jgi:hypothetical protein
MDLLRITKKLQSPYVDENGSFLLLVFTKDV